MPAGTGCNVCGKTENLKRCGFCKHAVYCSRQHQMEDWSRHKAQCKTPKKQHSNADASLTTSQPTATVARTDRDDASTATALCAESSRLEIPTKTDSDPRVQTEETARGVDEYDGEPFDTRHFKETTFPTLSSSDPESVATFATKQLKQRGFCVLDGLFPESEIDEALTNISDCETKGLFSQGKLEGGKTSGEEEKKTVKTAIRCDKIMWVQGTEGHIPGVAGLVGRMDAYLTAFNKHLKGQYFIYSRTKAMIACYPGNGTYYKRHVDNPNGDGRIITCILYLNKSWSAQEDGGVLRILPTNSDDYLDVSPVANRLLFFWSDRRNPHEVHPAYRPRYAITIWYFDQQERTKAKAENMNAEMANIRGDMALLEVKVREKEKATISKEIDDKASSAVASLSDGELEAIASMVDGHPDPRAVLSSIGIQGDVQDKLLDRLASLT